MFGPRCLWLVLLASLVPSILADPDPPLPLEDLDEADRATVERVLDRPTVVSNLDEQIVESPRSIYEFLLTHLDFAAEIARTYGIGRYRIARVGNSAFHVDDRDGAVASVRLLHRADRGADGVRCVYLARGHLVILGGVRVRGDALVVLDYKARDADSLSVRTGLRFRVDSGVLHRLGRVGERVLRRVLDRKVGLFVRAAEEASERVAEDPRGVYEKMSEVRGPEDEVIGEFRTVTLDRR